MHFGKRVLCLLLTAVILLGMMPVAQAAGEEDAVKAESNLSVEGTGSLGTMISNEVAQAQEANSQHGGLYSISDLTVEGNMAYVTYGSAEDAVLLVCIYSEDGLQLLNSGKCDVSASQTQAQVLIEGEMPAFFQATALLLDRYDLSPLCTGYSTPMYTQAFQELLDSTVHDYDADRVLNLDDDESTNFAVYAQDVVVLESTQNSNVVTKADYESQEYVIEQIDSQISSLAPGMIFACYYGETLLLVKIFQIRIDNTTATVVGQDMELEEVFAYLKIETAGDNDRVTVDESTGDEAVTFQGIVSDESPSTKAYEDDTEVGTSLSFFLEKEFKSKSDEDIAATVSGSVTLSVDASISFYISLKRQFIRVEAENSVKYAVTLTGSLTAKKGLDLPDVVIPTPIAGLNLVFEPELVWQFSVALELYGKLSMTLGFSYDSNVGFQSLSSKPKTEYDLSADGKIFIGLQLTSSIAVISKEICTLGFSFSTGVEINGEMLGTEHETVTDGQYKIHTCSQCLALDFDFVLEGSAEATFLRYFKVKRVFLTIRKDLMEMYVSYDPDHLEMGIGTCPYYDYRVTVQVRDSEGKIVKNQQVFVDDNTSLGFTGSSGSVVTYLSAGEYRFQTTIGETKLEVLREIDNSTKVVLTNNPKILEWINNYTKLLIQTVSTKGQVRLKYGSFSNGVKWTLYESGKLVIEGKADIPYFSSASEAPWYSVRSKIKQLEIKEGVTGIGGNAFAGCTNLEKVIIPDTVSAYLGQNAFSGCTGLKEIRLPVDYVVHKVYSGTDYTGAFSGCVNVTKIQYGPGATGNMTSRQTMNYNDNYYMYSLEYISRNALHTVIFEEGVVSVGNYAYYQTDTGVSKLSTVYLPESLTYIGSFAFYKTGQLKELPLPERLKTISTYAFYQSGLTQIQFPESLTTIGNYAFSGCTGLTSLIIGDHLRSGMMSYAFSNCTGLKTVTLPVDYHVHTYYPYNTPRSGAFVGCSNVETIYYSYGGTGIMLDRQTSTGKDHYYQESLEYACRENLKQVFFDEGILHVGDYAFYEFPVLELVDLPSTLTSIGMHSFSKTSALKSIPFPEGLKTISSYAFYQSGLTQVLFPESLTTIGNYAFSGCTGLTSLVIGDQLRSGMMSYAFSNCTGLKTVTLPVDYHVHTYYPYNVDRNGAFVGCSNVETIYYTYGSTGIMLDRQTSTGEDHYYQESLEYACRENLKQVYFQAGITHVGDYAYFESPVLERVVLPSTLTSIGYHSFSKTAALKSIPFPESLKTISSYAFYQSGLTQVLFPESLTTIGNYAFSGCTGLTSLVIGDQLNNGMMTYAFSNCTGLKTVTLPVDYHVHTYYPYNVDRNGAFVGCSNVETIYYTYGSTGRMKDRTTNSSKDHYYQESLEYACRENLKQVYFAEGILSVSNYAFTDCVALQQIHFAGTAPYIGSIAFSNVNATVYYPAQDTTWEQTVNKGYGGTLTWESTAISQKAEIAPSSESSVILIPQFEAAPEAQIQPVTKTAQRPAVRGVHPGETNSYLSQERVVQTTLFTQLVPEADYVMFAVLDPQAADPLSHENLLAVSWGTADGLGSLSFQYVPRTTVESYYTFATGPTNQNLSDATISFPPMYADGEWQVVSPEVTYNGQVLQEEADYILLGEVDFTKPGTYTCYIRGVRAYTGTVKCTYEVWDWAEIARWSLTLKDTIHMNFSVSVNETLASDATANVTVADKSYSFAVCQLPRDEQTGQYLITVPLAAAQMTDTVTLELWAQEQLLDSGSYSVQQYAQRVLDGNYDSTLKTLVTQMLIYGGAAQEYFDYRPEDLAGQDLEPITQTAIPQQWNPPISATGRIPGLSFYGASLLAQSQIGMRFYFQTNGEDFRFTVGQKDVSPVSSGSLTYIQIDGIRPGDLEESVCVQVTDGTNTVTVSYAPMHYLCRMYYNADKQHMQPFLLALYNYHLAAEAYQTSKGI